MPYIPSKKTDGKSQDRILIDKEIKEVLAPQIATEITNNKNILKVYLRYFIEIGEGLKELDVYSRFIPHNLGSNNLVKVIWKIAEKYNYQGAFLGLLNYAITILIQEVPKQLVQKGKQEKELRYFIYAYTVEALTKASYYFNRLPEMTGIGGVFEDIKDEYKRRVNTSYEAHQIVKSGDCYYAPYHTQLVEVIKDGKHLGYMEIMLKHGDFDGQDIMKGKLYINES
jgi:hypothetical protein